MHSGSFAWDSSPESKPSQPAPVMIRFFFVIAGMSGFLAVALGAFGAHGLRGRIEENLFRGYETGVTYHMSHTLALLMVCILMQLWGPRALLQFSAAAFVLGILFFSGSLYAMALTGIRSFGPVTPFGGLFFLLGWGSLSWAVWKNAG